MVGSCGKRRKCWLPAMSPFPTKCSKALFLRVFKSFFKQSRLLMTLRTEAFENILRKKENAGNQHCLLFPRHFLPFQKQFVMSNFSFSHSVFKRVVSQGRQKVSLCGNRLTLSQTSPGFHVCEVQIFWKHYGKRRNCS